MKDTPSKVEVSGFKDLDAAQMILLRKTIDNYERKFLARCRNYEELKITLKKIHEQKHSEKYEVRAKLFDNGKPYQSTVSSHNIHVAVEEALSNVERELERAVKS